MTYFVFCIHNHQPVGNFDSVLEEAYQLSYWPFLKELAKHPAIRLSIHNTGYLIDWIEKNHPEYIDLLRSLVEAGQVEIIGGGYYEPILCVIPEYDRVAQVRMMSDRIEELFGKRPRGIWLAERVWEPGLPSVLKEAGVEYLLVDDYHFIKSGLTRGELGGYYITEDQGSVIKVFPGSERLRYLIPFKPVEDLTEYLKGFKSSLKTGNAAIYGDDGEKFGVWPGTHKWVFDEGWLEKFFNSLERSLDWLKPVGLGEYVDAEGPVGRVYLPSTSYMEMGEWALPSQASREFTGLLEEVKGWENGGRVKRFLQGGNWRNFFSKYPESNWMHKRMLQVSYELKARAAGRQWDDGLSRAEKHLYRAQCNDAFWHGVFGGLYLPHLRTTLYENLIGAETMAHAGLDGAPTIRTSDVDADGEVEAEVRTRDLNCFFSPHRGAGLLELDYKPRPVNFSNTLSRWFEGYHYKLTEQGREDQSGGAKSIHDMVKMKEEGLEKYLKYDTVRRASFVDHFLKSGETLEEFISNSYAELGDFANSRYALEVRDGSLVFSRQGSAAGAPVLLTKTVDGFEDDSFKVSYGIEQKGSGVLPDGLRFAVEFNFLLPCCDGPATYYDCTPPFEGIGLGSTGAAFGVEKIRLVDKYAGVSLDISSDRPATLWRFPLYTVSLSEGGFEKIYQGSCLVFIFPALFEKGREEVSFTVRAGKD